MLLDTHVWRWYAAGDAKRIGPRARRDIERARAKGALVVSVASMFELAALSAAGRLRFVPSAESWMRQSIDLGRIQVAEMTSAIAIEAASIPAVVLPDPMDRVLVATARTLGIPFATRDARIIEHLAGVGAGRALDVSK
jgi:PIN domain nuclease of toxin-antitoxin system